MTDVPSRFACRLCGRSLEDEETWLGLEVNREPEGDVLDAAFCSQEHAAQWLAEPLPEPLPPTMEPMPAREWQERLTVALLIACTIWGLAMALIGCWTFAQWVLN